MSDLVTIVSNVGFPIFACVMLFQQQKELNKAIAELSSTLKTIDARIDNIENKTMENQKIIQGVA